jgi:ElaB/YqjD/DUF883 family membrane-anchored ribosome-binding protein
MTEIDSTWPASEQDEAGDSGMTTQAKDKAREVASQAGDKAQQIGETAKSKVSEATGQAQDRIRQEIDERSTRAGEQVGTMAHALRTTGEQLRNDGQGSIAGWVESAADRVDGCGAYLRGSDGQRIMSDAQDFARRYPWAVAGVGVVAGFFTARFLKASNENVDGGWATSMSRVAETPETASSTPSEVEIRPDPSPETASAPRVEPQPTGTTGSQAGW